MPAKRRTADGRPPYFRLYVDDFDAGVSAAGMTLEQEGFYGRFLRAQWRMQGPLIDNPKIIAKHLRLTLQPCRRLLEDLVAMGPTKIMRGSGIVWNPRLQKEIDRFRDWSAKHGVPTANPQGVLPLESAQPQAPQRRRSTGSPRRVGDIVTQDPRLQAAITRIGQNIRNVPPWYTKDGQR